LKFSGFSPENQGVLTCFGFSAGYVLLVGFEKYRVLQRLLFSGVTGWDIYLSLSYCNPGCRASIYFIRYIIGMHNIYIPSHIPIYGTQSPGITAVTTMSLLLGMGLPNYSFHI
jgi:hypothetical protein